MSARRVQQKLESRSQPNGKHLGWLYSASNSSRLVFVTKEADGLYYVWIREDLGEKPSWTYAFKSKKKAFEQMETTAGYRVRPNNEAGRLPRLEPIE